MAEEQNLYAPVTMKSIKLRVKGVETFPSCNVEGTFVLINTATLPKGNSLNATYAVQRLKIRELILPHLVQYIIPCH